MNPKYNKYITSFRNFADELAESCLKTDGVVDISKSLSQKANQLVTKAIFTGNVDTKNLKRELYDLEQKYIAIILSRVNQNL